MSRVGKEPIPIPEGVEITIDDGNIRVVGKLGELEYQIPPGIGVTHEDKILSFRRSDDSRHQKSLHGLARALTANMVQGVSIGFSKSLEIVGVGYRCDQKGSAIMLSVGFSHRVVFVPPEEVTIKVNSNTSFTVSGIDRQKVGDVAANLRLIKPPEPYKGKGIKYAGEWIRRKAGKTTVK